MHRINNLIVPHVPLSQVSLHPTLQHPNLIQERLAASRGDVRLREPFKARVVARLGGRGEVRVGRRGVKRDAAEEHARARHKVVPQHVQEIDFPVLRRRAVGPDDDLGPGREEEEGRGQVGEGRRRVGPLCCDDETLVSEVPREREREVPACRVAHDDDVLGFEPERVDEVVVRRDGVDERSGKRVHGFPVLASSRDAVFDVQDARDGGGVLQELVPNRAGHVRRVRRAKDVDPAVEGENDFLVRTRRRVDGYVGPWLFDPVPDDALRRRHPGLLRPLFDVPPYEVRSRRDPDAFDGGSARDGGVVRGDDQVAVFFRETVSHVRYQMGLDRAYSSKRRMVWNVRAKSVRLSGKDARGRHEGRR